MSADDGRPSRAGYWVGGGVAVLGVVGAVLWFVLMLTSFTNEIKGFERVPADGEPRQVTLSRTGSYTAYYEPSSGSLDDESDHSVDAEVVGPNGRNVVLEPYVSKLTYTLGGHNGRAVFTFRVDAPAPTRCGHPRRGRVSWPSGAAWAGSWWAASSAASPSASSGSASGRWC